MSYDKDWEVHLALNDPNDPIHDYMDQSRGGGGNMIEFSQSIKDWEGNEISVGTKVRYYETTAVGEVIEITDWDGDADDEGRSIMNPPTVKVKYADLQEPVEYTTSEWVHSEGGWVLDADGDPEPGWNRAEGKCEELVVVK